MLGVNDTDGFNRMGCKDHDAEDGAQHDGIDPAPRAM